MRLEARAEAQAAAQAALAVSAEAVGGPSQLGAPRESSRAHGYGHRSHLHRQGSAQGTAYSPSKRHNSRSHARRGSLDVDAQGSKVISGMGRRSTRTSVRGCLALSASWSSALSVPVARGFRLRPKEAATASHACAY